MMVHDPKAQDVMTARLMSSVLARDVLDALADAGLCVVSDAAEPADAEQRAAPFDTAQHRQTFTEPIEDPYMHMLHSYGRSCGVGGCPCRDRP